MMKFRNWHNFKFNFKFKLRPDSCEVKCWSIDIKWHVLIRFSKLPSGNYMFKVNNRNTRKRCKIYSRLPIKTPERHYWRRSGVFIVNCEHTLHLFLVSLANIEQVNSGWAAVSGAFQPQFPGVQILWKRSFRRVSRGTGGSNFHLMYKLITS